MAETTLQGCGVYRILNLANGKFYIGSSTEVAGRRMDHLYALRANRHHSYRLQADYDLHGEASIVFEMVEQVDDTDQLLAVEQWWMDHTRSYDEGVGYNISPTAGNTLGKPCLPATREKIGNAHRGRRQSPNTIARRMDTLASPEHKERMARWFRSEETRAKISKTKGGSGYVLTASDIRDAISLYQAGDISILKLAGRFNVSYQQMRNALSGMGPKFASVRQSVEKATAGSDLKSVARKIALSLSTVTVEVADEIRRLYAVGDVLQTTLADRFGINKVTVHRIIKGKHIYGSASSDPLETTNIRLSRIESLAPLLRLLETSDDEPLGPSPEG
jgi:group I intron endonuclease